MCSICFACCPPCVGCVLIGILQIIIHIVLYVLNKEYGIIQAIAYASDEQSKIIMIILMVIGLIDALILIYGATTRNIICLQLWMTINTIIISAFTIGLIYCAFVAKDKTIQQKKTFWHALKRIFSFSIYQKFIKRIVYYVSLIVIITIQIFLTFIAHDFTREMIMDVKLKEVGERSEDNNEDDHYRHRHSHKRRHQHEHEHHSHRRHPHHIRRIRRIFHRSPARIED